MRAAASILFLLFVFPSGALAEDTEIGLLERLIQHLKVENRAEESTDQEPGNAFPMDLERSEVSTADLLELDVDIPEVMVLSMLPQDAL